MRPVVSCCGPFGHAVQDAGACAKAEAGSGLGDFGAQPFHEILVAKALVEGYEAYLADFTQFLIAGT